MIQHDPFCLGGNSPVEGYDGKYSCNCDFIARVREDERTKVLMEQYNVLL